MADNNLEFQETQPIADFLVDLGASKMQIIRNPKTNGETRFFAVPGTKVTGAIANSVEKLSLELSVSTVHDPKKGETFYMVHGTSSDNVEDELTL